MHRLLLLACLLGAATAYSRSWPSVFRHDRVSYRTPYKHRVSAADTVKDIQKELLELALKMRRFCPAQSNRALKQAFTSTHYTLTANLTGCSEDGLTVRAGQRLIAVQVSNVRCQFVTLQLLPDVVDATSAFWRLKEDQLKVYFPYDLDYGRCGREISDRVHSLPMLGDDIEDPDTDVQFEMGSSEELADLIQ